MGKCVKLCTLFLTVALAFGCAAQKNSQTSGAQVKSEKTVQAVFEPELIENDHATGQTLVKKAKTAIGTPYVSGGEEPGGFDCSGLVKWAYNSIGVNLPRTAREQSTVGQKIKKVEDMRAGDIVAFKHPKRGYHTGIYVGDGKFIHSPRRRTRVRINSLDDPYFSSTFLSARRVSLSGAVVAEAESRLEEYLQKKGELKVSAKNMRAASSKSIKGKKVASSKTAKSGRTTKSLKKSESKSQKTAAKKSSKTAKSKIARAPKNKSVKQVAHNKTEKTVAHNNKNKKSGKQTASVKKSPSKAVSMLNKKTKSGASRRHRS